MNEAADALEKYVESRFDWLDALACALALVLTVLAYGWMAS